MKAITTSIAISAVGTVAGIVANYTLNDSDASLGILAATLLASSAMMIANVFLANR